MALAQGAAAVVGNMETTMSAQASPIGLAVTEAPLSWSTNGLVSTVAAYILDRREANAGISDSQRRQRT